MIRHRYQITGEYSYKQRCSCEFCEGHDATDDLDARVFELDFAGEPDTNDILGLVAEILDGEGKDDVDFDRGEVLIEDLGEVPVDVVLRQLGAPMLPGFQAVIS